MSEKETIEDVGDEISLLELWKIFKNRFAYFIITLIIIMGCAYVYLQNTIPKYSSSVTVLVDPIEASSSLDDMLLSGVSSGTSKIQTEVELITSKRNLQNALSSFDLSAYKNKNGQTYDTFYKLSGNSENISVTSVKDTNLVTISIIDENPKFAADLANAISVSYDEMLTGIARTSKTTQREFLEQQIPLNEKELQVAADKLSDYKEKSGIMQLTEKSSTLVNQIAYFDVKEEPLKLSKIGTTELLTKYAKELKTYSIVLPSVYELTRGDVINELKKAYSSASTELLMYNLAYAGVLTGSTANADDLNTTSILINTKISKSNQMLDEINKTLYQYSNGEPYVDTLLVEYGKSVVEVLKDDIEISALVERSKVYNDELDKLPFIERQVAELERTVTVLQQVGLDLRSMLEQIKLTEAAVSGNVTVIDYAEIPLTPISPNKFLIMVVALFFGVAFGFLACIIVNFRDNTLNTREDVRNVIRENIPLLGWIPLLTNRPVDKKEHGDSLLYSSIPVYNDPSSLISEKFMSITSNIIYGKALSNNQVMSITSCGMSSGKSSAVTNIAMCLAQMGSKVILVDGDFRMPAILSTFGYSRSRTGCVEVILGNKKLEDVIVQPIPDVSNLHVLPVGHKPQVPSSIIGNPRFSKLLDILRSNYDYILIDAPPLDYASEVLSIGKMSDTVLINVRAGITPKESLKELLIDLDAIKEKINGVILNGFIPSTTDRGGRVNDKYGHSYGYGYGYGANKGDNKENNVKIVSKSKAKRMEIKIYKSNISNRENNDIYLQSLKNYPNIASNIDFGIDSEDFKHNLFNKKSMYHINNLGFDMKKEKKSAKDGSVIEEKIDNDTEKNLENNVPKFDANKNDLSSILEDLKKDSGASGRKE